MDKMKDILTTELFPKKHDWLLSAFGVVFLVPFGLSAIPHWRMSVLLFFVASAGLTHVLRRFRGRPFVPMPVIMAAATLTVCFFLLVRTGYIGEGSIVMVATAFGWLGIIAIQCAALVHYLVRTRHSNKCIDSDNQ